MLFSLTVTGPSQITTPVMAIMRSAGSAPDLLARMDVIGLDSELTAFYTQSIVTDECISTAMLTVIVYSTRKPPSPNILRRSGICLL